MKIFGLLVVCLLQVFMTPGSAPAARAAAPGPVSAVVRFSGQISEVGPARWMVAGQLLRVDGDTKIASPNGAPASGMFARATAQWRPGAELRATMLEVRSLPFPLDGGARSLSGPVQSLYASFTTAEPVVLSGRLLAKIDDTQPEQWLLLRDGDGPRLAAETIVVDRQVALIDERYGPAQAGAWLEVTATPLSLSFDAWSARRVLVAAGPQDSIEGVIDSISEADGSGVVAVGGQAVILDTGTQLDGRLRVGRYALVSGSRHASDTLWAAQMDVRYRFTGTLVERIFHDSMETWVIAVQIDESGIDTSRQARVYLFVDQSTLVDPALQNAPAGVVVAVQARAAAGGWVGDWINPAGW